MGGDYTRWTFNPAKDYAEVFKQQGRVDLDADWNEFVEIVNRRWRAETIDVIGRAIVPQSTHNAFNITPTGPGQFTIGVGRMYVDGLLAECHGTGTTTYDASLGEINGASAIPFTSQPDYPNPKPLPSPAPDVDLIYLDVWQREVTAVQDPNIREKALGGPDTDTRMQTVWQVKILPNVGSHACGDDIAAWDTLVAPSAGRLTATTVTPTPSPDPCILSPTGGYRGLENRLYRVEIHVAGVVGGADPTKRAKFKWSRDNASVVSALDSISASGAPNSIVTLKSLGRDRVLRFQAGDWVEIMDDQTEFGMNDFDGASFVGTAGFLTKIVSPPDEANRTITVNPPIPAGLFDPTKPDNHTRVRRWDQRNTGGGSNVDPNTGLIEVTAGPLDIEDGIQVSFIADPSIPGGLLHVGDYWVFAARTADGKVDTLQNAPPLGILHHYARLGFVTWTATGGRFDNCRQFWPPPFGDCTGCCTVTVGDGVNSKGQFTDIQAAINALGPAGGEVCIGRGIFIVTDTIRVDATRKNVVIRGMGWATKIIFSPDVQAGTRILFDVQDTSQVTLESFFAVAPKALSMVRFTDCKFCAVRDTALINLNIAPTGGSAFSSSSFAAVTTALAGRAIELLGVCVDCEIDRNTLVAAKGVVSGPGAAATGRGTISGAVTALDATGASIQLPAATVTLTAQAGASQTATTDSQGKFSFPNLPAGDYTISATAAGFSSTSQSVTVVANSTALVNLLLQPAGVTGALFSSRPQPAAVITTSAPSDVNHLSIRENRILALQVSILLVKTEDCAIINNRLLGLSANAVKALQSVTLTRDNIDTFQQAVLTVLTSAGEGFAFQAAAIVLLTGSRITIADNTMMGLIGVVSFYLAEARLEDNQIFGLLGLLVLNGMAVRVSGNFIAGLFAGWVQAGLLLDFESNSNFWLGLDGLVFLPWDVFQKDFGQFFGAALESAGFAAPGSNLVGSITGSVSDAGARLGPVGLVGVVKIHHEVFFNFNEAIAASLVLSGDIRITDSSFEVCRINGIRWFSLPQGKAISNLLPPVHVVEGNTFNVQGLGIRFQCLQGVFQNNTIQCPQTALQLACQSGTVQNNEIKGTATQPNQSGLIVLFPTLEVSEPSFKINGNRLLGGQGHGILISGSLVNLTIEDNVIEGMALNGIMADTIAFLQSIRISGNDISRCKGAVPSLPFGTSGAIILPEVATNLLVQGNRLVANGGIGMFLNGLSFGATTDLRLLIQNNCSQDTDGTNRIIIAAGYAIQFTGNQCIERLGTPLTQPIVILTGQWIDATGNTVLRNQSLIGNAVGSLLLQQYPGAISSAIAISNILNRDVQIGGIFQRLIISPNIGV